MNGSVVWSRLEEKARCLHFTNKNGLLLQFSLHIKNIHRHWSTWRYDHEVFFMLYFSAEQFWEKIGKTGGSNSLLHGSSLD